jgi:drug/metabolite transporter (DMT)-like permease
MLLLAHVIFNKRLPSGKEWKQLAIYGLLNISIYLGLYVIAMQKVSAGLGALAVASNPVFISLIAAVFFKHAVTYQNILSLLLCVAGVITAAFPLLQNSIATWDGLVIIFTSMLAYSAAAIYFSKVQWGDLHILTINGWQTILGGIFLLPVLLFTYHAEANHFNVVFWQSVLWLAIPVSIVAVLLWLHLLKQNPVTASYWLFLCPVFGFIIAKFMVQEPISNYTKLGVVMVIGGLLLIQKKDEST